MAQRFVKEQNIISRLQCCNNTFQNFPTHGNENSHKIVGVLRESRGKESTDDPVDGIISLLDIMSIIDVM